MIITTQEEFKEFYPKYSKENLVISTLDKFEISNEDNLKDQYFFLEEIYNEIWENILDREKMNKQELWRTNGLEQKHLDKIYNYSVSNPYPIIKASFFRYIYNYTIRWDSLGYKLRTTIQQVLIYLINTFGFSNDDDFFDFFSLVLKIKCSMYDIFSCNSIKNSILDKIKDILLKDEKNTKLIEMLNQYNYSEVKLDKLYYWYDNKSEVLKKSNDLYFIYENDPYLKYQSEISDLVDTYYKINYKKQLIIYTELELIDGFVSSGQIDRLIQEDKTNNYLKSVMLRYLALCNYYNIFDDIYYSEYRKILNNSSIRLVSKDDFLEILTYTLKLIDTEKYWDEDYFKQFFKSIAKTLLEFKNNSLYDDEIKNSIKKVIFTYNKEKLSNYIFQSIGFEFYPDNFGMCLDNFMLANIKDFEKLKDLFTDIYNLGKDSKPDSKKSNLVQKKANKLPRELIRNIFYTAIDSLLKSNINDNNRLLQESNETFFRGLLYLLPIINDFIIYTKVANLCQKCFMKNTMSMFVSEKIGNACINALSLIDDIYSLSLISRLKYQISHSKAKSNIISILNKESKKRKISIEELEDLGVNDFGIKDGKLTITILNYTVEINIIDFNNIKTSWYDNKQNKVIKSPEKTDISISEQVTEIKELIKEIEKTISSQKERFESFYIKDRTFSFRKWRELFIDNELLKFISKKLIWEFKFGKKTFHGFILEENIVNNKGKILKQIEEDNTIVSLWHPVNSKVEDVICWRNFIIENSIKQPFKQAYREAYLLTDAEIKTKNYSNRFASHILKQHQFSKLARIKGWEYNLLGNYDDGKYNEIAKKRIDKYNIIAEFWLNEINDDDSFNDSGIWLYVFTDQVRFRMINSKMDLRNVPEIIFSEIMRDIDLFVGVTSIGSDPNWGIVGENYNEYWNKYSFGELSETAKTRKYAIEKILPKLKISNKCQVEDKYLKVNGDFRTYKIHLGSTNILMEPNDQYLCIVPDKKTNISSEEIFLPFDDDKIFSLILSKAFLLANDKDIKDKSILNQINNYN